MKGVWMDCKLPIVVASADSPRQEADAKIGPAGVTGVRVVLCAKAWEVPLLAERVFVRTTELECSCSVCPCCQRADQS